MNVRRAWNTYWLVPLAALACGPDTSTTTSTTVANTESSTLDTTDATTTTSSTTAATTASATTSSDSSTTDEEVSCSTLSNTCPPGECCRQDVPGIFVCSPFGSGCSCQTDRDCTNGEICTSTSIKGELNCVECGDDEHCGPGQVCIDGECEQQTDTGSTTSGSTGDVGTTGTSSG